MIELYWDRHLDKEQYNKSFIVMSISFLGNILQNIVFEWTSCAGVPQVSLIKFKLAVDSTCRPTLTVDINKKKWNSNYFILIAIHTSSW